MGHLGCCISKGALWIDSLKRNFIVWQKFRNAAFQKTLFLSFLLRFVYSHITKMKLRSRTRCLANTIKREDCSLQTNAYSEARVLLPDATLSVKQDLESCTLVKQEEPSTSVLISNMQVEPNEEICKTIKQEEISKTRTALGKYVDKLQDDQTNQQHVIRT